MAFRHIVPSYRHAFADLEIIQTGLFIFDDQYSILRQRPSDGKYLL